MIGGGSEFALTGWSAYAGGKAWWNSRETK
jgi:hypothetical protein